MDQESLPQPLANRRRANGQFDKGNKVGHRFKPGESGNPTGRPKAWLSQELQRQLPSEAKEIVSKLILRSKKSSNDLGLLWNRAEGAVEKEPERGAQTINVLILPPAVTPKNELKNAPDPAAR